MKEIIIKPQEAQQRLDKFLLKYLNNCPKSFIYKGMRTNKIKLNGKKPKGAEILQAGDVLRLFWLDEQLETLTKEKTVKKVDIHFQTVYEDDELLVVNKPMGLLTQKDTADGHSLADEVLYYLQEKGSFSPDTANGFTPAPCNRLDRNTVGIVLVGKSIPALQALSSMLQTKEISKYYMCIVLGNITSPMILKGYHKRQDGNKNEVVITDEYVEGAKPVETRILPLKTNGRYTLVEVQLVTGKTHQIRAHLSQIGHPIIGDPKYGDPLENQYFKQKYGLKYQILCAYKVKFELCKPPLEYLQDRVFTVPAPTIYSQICEGEHII